MKKFLVFALILSSVTMLSCRGRRHDMAFYEHQIDSIRKAEQQKELEKKMGLGSNPVLNWFDTLQLRPLPIQTAGADVDRIASFTIVPSLLNEHFGYPEKAHLKAVALPNCHGCRVVLLCEMKDSITPALHLYTIDQDLQPIDILTLYEEKAETRQEGSGLSFNEYFITSSYEIAVMSYFRPRQNPEKPLLQGTRLFTISREGLFEEKVIEL